MRPSALAPLVVVSVGAALLFPLTGALDRRRPAPPDVLELLPPSPILPVLTFGHRQTAADLLEIEATTFLMQSLQRMDRLRHEHVTRLYDAILTLDPGDPGAHWRAAVFYFAVADRPDLARKILLRGIEASSPEHPLRVQLFVELASLEILTGAGKPEEERLAHVRRAGEVLLGAVGSPGASADLEEFGRRLATRGLSSLEALRFEEQLWADRTQQGEPAMREHAAARLRETRAAVIAESLQLVADDVTRQTGRAPHDLADLLRFVEAATRTAERGGGRLPEMLEALRERGTEDPLGAGFYLEGSRVVAPGLEAVRLERELDERFLRWQPEHPGETPTLEDLGAPTVAPFLAVRLDPSGATVRVRDR